jgi:cathepsin B
MLLMHGSFADQHVTGDYLGGHAIKIFGWGVENGTPYWWVANSWNKDWVRLLARASKTGDTPPCLTNPAQPQGLAGTFKILRGSDECGIEDGVVAGMVV